MFWVVTFGDQIITHETHNPFEDQISAIVGGDKFFSALYNSLETP